MSVYKCDPTRYAECEWRFGYLCGFVCKGTMHVEHAMLDSEGKPIEISDDDDEEDYD